jgi:hypothetical protein
MYQMILWDCTHEDGKAFEQEFDSIESALDYRQKHFGGYPGEIVDSNGEQVAILTEKDVYMVRSHE